MRHMYPFPYQTFSRLDMSAGSPAWITVPYSEQSFTSGNWTGGFSHSANGDQTNMSLEIDWVAGAYPLGPPYTDHRRVGYSTHDTQLSFLPSAKTRIFAVLLEYTDISQLTVANNLQKLICGLYVSEVGLGSSISTTCGSYTGVEITGGAVPVDGNFLTFDIDSVSNTSNLVLSTVDTPTINSMYLLFSILPNGRIVQNFCVYDKDNAGDDTWSDVTKLKTAGFQTPTSGSTIKIGAWFGTGKTAQQVGDFYTFSYRLRYAYAELS